ncbi:hypothetical protein NHQ30_009657 [Ciborinia camelliae]|nr:hypothetical protein NHQ30_009657 [Ciborinia camelliae]
MAYRHVCFESPKGHRIRSSTTTHGPSGLCADHESLSPEVTFLAGIPASSLGASTVTIHLRAIAALPFVNLFTNPIKRNDDVVAPVRIPGLFDLLTTPSTLKGALNLDN